jgi:hypothetical protein
LENTKKKLLVLLKIILFMIIAAGLFTWLYKFPQTIDLEYPAIEYRVDDKLSVQERTIRIKGTLSHPMFRNASFKGEFIIDKYDFTKTYDLVEMIFHKDIKNGWSSLTYNDVQNGQPILKSVGSIEISGDFDKLNIQVYEPLNAQSKSATDLRISAPSKKYDEAFSINQMFKD